jgi:hypothetical protein
MIIPFYKTRLLASCLAFSLLAHIICLYALKMFGTYDFTAPVNQPSQWVMVNLVKPGNTVSPAVNPEKHGSSDTDHVSEDVKVVRSPAPASEKDTSTPPANPEQRRPEMGPTSTPFIGAERIVSSIRSNEATSANPPDETRQPVITNPLLLPLRSNEFLAAKYEKLTYLISMLGIPVGNAELESKNEKGEISITLRVRSNDAISSIYPVDDVVETRHIDGRFIMTKIRQQEGSFRSDEMFTINLGKKRVSWDDSIRNRSLKTTVPADDVLDTLSGIYYLRNRHLEVGRTETLHIYDSETYADVPVEILRREELRLPNFTKVDTLVVRPLQQTAGIFRRTGDVLIWLTDDAYKVPVKIVTSIALGKVTAELVSAESKPPEGAVKEN